MKGLKAIEVEVPYLDLTLWVRPFGGWFVVTADDREVVGEPVAFRQYPEAAMVAAIDYLTDMRESIARRREAEDHLGDAKSSARLEGVAE